MFQKNTAQAVNTGHLKRLDTQLKERYDSIQQITAQIELYVTVIQHGANNFEEMNDELYEQTIKNEIIEPLKTVSQEHYLAIEETVGEINGVCTTLKQLVSQEEEFN